MHVDGTDGRLFLCDLGFQLLTHAVVLRFETNELPLQVSNGVHMRFFLVFVLDEFVIDVHDALSALLVGLRASKVGAINRRSVLGFGKEAHDRWSRYTLQ